MTYQFHHSNRNSQILAQGIFVSAYPLMPKKPQIQIKCLECLEHFELVILTAFTLNFYF